MPRRKVPRSAAALDDRSGATWHALADRRPRRPPHSAARRSRSAFAITDTELRLIAARGDHRAEQQTPKNGIEHARRDRHAERVVDEREEQVLADVAHRRAATAARARTMPRRSPFTSVTPALSHRDVGAGAHRDADVGLRERGRVVDAVARHRDDAALAPAARARPRAFCSGSTSAMHLVDARARARPPAAVVAAVAGQHHDAQAVARAARASASGVVALIGSATPSRPAGAAVDGDEHDRLPVARAAPRRASASAPTSTPSSLEQRGVAERDARGRRRAPTTPLPGARLRSRRRAASATPRSCAPPRRSPPRADARCRARGSRRAAAARVSSKPAAATTATSCGLPFGERAGLVDDQRVDARAASRAPRRSGTARRRCAPRPVADHDRHRRREPERARARDDQHRDRVDERVREARLGPDAAPTTANVSTRDRDHRRHEPRRRRGRRAAGSARGCAAPRATSCDDLREQRVGADALGAHHEACRCR